MADPPPNPGAKGKPAQGKKVQPQGVQLLPLLVKYFKQSGFLLGVWGLGYFNFSCTWVMLGLFLYMLSTRYRKIKDARKAYAEEVLTNERESILARVEELPAWVYFPDVERAEWLNKMLSQLWPYIGVYAKNLMKNSIEPTINNNLPKTLQPFKFEQIDLGDVPPRVGGVKVYTQNVRRDEIIMDMEIFYASDCNIKVAVRGINSGIKDLQIHGTVRVVMTPLCSVMPLVGGLNIIFLNSPAVEFDLTDAANILDFPLLSETLRTVIQDQIAYFMVLPNKLPIQLVSGIDMSQLKFPHPQGILRMQVVAGRELKAADVKLIGKAKSDPYIKLYIGAEVFKTKVIKDTVSPVWNEFFEAVVEQKHGQFAEIECLDEDPGDDDELGTASVDVQTIAAEGKLDTWLPLEGVSTGMIHIRALWLHLSKDPNELDEEERRRRLRIRQITPTGMSQKERMRSGTEDHLSAALLMVHIDSASSLLRSKKSMKEPSPYVKLSVGHETKKSIPKQRTSDPKWEENFQFLIHDPMQQDLTIEVMDSEKNRKLGVLIYQIKNLLAVSDMTIPVRPFSMQNGGPESKIYMRLALRILTSEKPPEWARDEPVGLSVEAGNLDKEDHGSSVDATSTSVDTGIQEHTSTQKPPPKPESPDDSARSPHLAQHPGLVEELVPEEAPSVETQPPVSAGQPASSSPTQQQQPDSELRQRKPPPSPSQGSQGPSLGRIQLTLRYSPQRNKLVLVIHRCQNLLACDDNELSDPYVRMYLLPERSSSTKRKTQVVKDNLNPIYDESFDWNMSATEAATKQIEILVKNQVGMFSKNRTRMGQLILDLSKIDLAKATTDWYELQEPEDKDD